jgi:hypothetical protein
MVGVHSKWAPTCLGRELTATSGRDYPVAEANVLPYARKPGNHPFREPEVLNVDALRKMWLPWSSLETADSSHVLAKNSYVIWTVVRHKDADDILARPWVSMYASGGLRSFVIGQLRGVDHLATEAAGVPPTIKEFRETWPEWVAGTTPLRQLQATAMLGTLTATSPLLGTPEPDPSRPDPVFQHYCYERAKAIRMRDLHHAPSVSVMNYLAEHAVEPAIRMLAVIHLLTYAIRIEGSMESAEAWRTRGVKLLSGLDAHPEWLALLIEDRFHRIDALYHVRRGDNDRAQEALSSALVVDGKLRGAVAGSPLLRYVWEECHRLLLDISVRFHSRQGTPEAAAEFVAELDEIEPYYPDSRSAVGELYAASGRLPEAGRNFENAAAGGSIHGAVAAFRAYETYRRLDDRTSAERSLRLLADLDPAADTEQYEY